MRWALSGVVVLVLGLVRGALWSLFLDVVPGVGVFAGRVVPGVGMILGWVVSGALVLAVALWVSPLGRDEVRRCAAWLVALVLLDSVWRLVLLPLGLR